MKILLRVVTIVLLHLSTLSSQSEGQIRFNADERKIITLQDERRGVDTIAGYLTSSDPKVAWRAAIALANIGDSTARPYLIARLGKETRDTVAEAEAFALGMLGPSFEASNALLNSAADHPSQAKYVALGRTVAKSDAYTAMKFAERGIGAPGASKLAAVKLLVELSLRKINGQLMNDDLDEFGMDDDPEVRWRAAYAFARGGDSADLATRMIRLKDMLLDQGSRNTRMFAALAIGRVHNASANTVLWRAFRGEPDWHVRVNIVNALARFPHFDTLIFQTIASAVTSSLTDSSTAIHVGMTAMTVLDQMISAGKLSSSDSTWIREWISHFEGESGYYEEVAPVVRAMATLSAARLSSPTIRTAVPNYASMYDPQIRNIAVRAAGLMPDTIFFHDILESMPRVMPFQQLASLEALDSQWTYAKKHPAFMADLERELTANIYRHVLIRISDLVPNPAIISTAMEHVQDSSILKDSAFREEARGYFEGYLSKYNDRKHRDELISIVGAAKFLGSRSAGILSGLRGIYDSAFAWRDFELLDTTRSALRSLGQTVSTTNPPNDRVSTIDWKYLESMPDHVIVNLEHRSFEILLDTYDAPLTCMHMVKLMKDQYFVNQIVHRVVPNFVIQSGDLTGTGWGGPGYTIRTEISPLTYDVDGMVGMASSGKDTEGSQWFVTESPTPHLTGRYTIWAHVTSGMAEVNKVQQGEKVDTIIPYRTGPSGARGIR